MKAKVLHITGPCCAGKTHLIRNLTASKALPVWDAGVERKKSGTTAAAMPGLRAQLKHGSTTIVESSGQNRRLNSMLHEHADVRTIRLAQPSREQVAVRAKSRGITPSYVNTFNSKHQWPEGVSQSTAEYLANRWASA